MALSKKKQAELREEKDWEKIDTAVMKSEGFLEKYQKQILIVIGIFVVISCAYLAYEHFVVKPKTQEASVAIYKGEGYYRMGQDSLAIFGDGNGYTGLENIIKEYGSTSTGNLAKYYAGLCYANLGQYEKALEYLKSFNGKDLIVAHAANGAIGDCLSNTGKNEEAIAYYLKAAKGVDNEAQSPAFYKKAGILYRELGQNDKVIEIFTTIKDQYAASPIAAEADKYIDEAQMKKGAK